MTKLDIRFQSGFSLVTAIFLLVVLGTLGAMMATFFAAQQRSSALDVMGSRAYYAARAGIEWAAFSIVQTPAGTLWAGCAAVPNPLFAPAGAALAGDLTPFTVTLACVATPAADGGPIVIYDLTSTAVFGGAPGTPEYIERVLTLRMGN